MKKEKPILFSTEMVQAVLAGRKTHTRRCTKLNLVNPKHLRDNIWCESGNDDTIHFKFKCPYGQKGSEFWVRETFCKQLGGYVYRADGEDVKFSTFKWKPSIFMPRSASRIQLLIIDIRVERVQDITEEEAKSEGTKIINAGDLGNETYKSAFRRLWDSINANRKDEDGNTLPYSWKDNPWVWVVEFEIDHDPKLLQQITI